MGWIRIEWPAGEPAPDWVKQLNSEAEALEGVMDKDRLDAIKNREDWWNNQ